jgi:hypothetical protein
MDCNEYKANHEAFSKLPLPREIWDTVEWFAWIDHFHCCDACSDWTLAQQIVDRGFDPNTFPCVHIGNQVTTTCIEHPDPHDCPDILITHFARFDEYSISVSNGGTSAEVIRFCPWCGIRLPDSKRDRWFDELLALGYDDPVSQEIPYDFLTDAWYKNAQ